MKWLIGVVICATVVGAILSVLFRYEYISKSVRVPNQNQPTISYDIILRIDRFTGDKCLFEGGFQSVEIYDENLPGAPRDRLIDDFLHVRYLDATVCE
jgi:hypothetical protein